MDQWGQQPLRHCFNADANEVLVFGCDITTQPQYQDWARHDASLHLKCSRALPLAKGDDVVVLSGSLDQEYYDWLRSIDFGPAHVVAYGEAAPKVSLPELVLANPQPLRSTLSALNRKPVWIPFYSSIKEEELCLREGFRLFGCPEKTTLQFFDKREFKRTCRELGLPTMEGIEFAVSQNVSESRRGLELERIILALLHSHSSVVVRGTLGSAGKSVYEVNPENFSAALKDIAKDHGTQFLIEPRLQVVASPNDQWCITEKGRLEHLGASAQLFAGFKHVGNLYGQYFSPRVMAGIHASSLKIADHMHRSGYRGIFGIDYIVADEGVFPIENNARLNGSTFAIGIIDNMRESAPDISCWKFFRARVSPCSFSKLRTLLGSLIFSRGSVNAIFPFDCDQLLKHGIFAALLAAEDLYHIEHLERALGQLGVEKV